MSVGDRHSARAGAYTIEYIEGTDSGQHLTFFGTAGLPGAVRNIIPTVGVVNIADPSSELSKYDGYNYDSSNLVEHKEYGALLLCYELQSPNPSSFSLYMWDGGVTTNQPPWWVPGLTGSWRLVATNWRVDKFIMDRATLGELYIGDWSSSFEVDFTGASPTDVLGWNGTKWVAQASDTPGLHHESHENGGLDEINLAGLSGMTVDGLDDATITGVGNDEILGYSGGSWINRTLTEAGIVSTTAEETITGLKTFDNQHLYLHYDVSSVGLRPELSVQKARGGDTALSVGDELGVFMLEGMVTGPQWEDLVGFSGKVTNVGVGTFESEAWIGISNSGNFDRDAFKFGSDRKVDCAGYKVNGSPLALSHLSSYALGDLSDVTVTGVGNDEVLGYSGGGWINRTLTEAGIVGVAAEETITGLKTFDNQHFYLHYDIDSVSLKPELSVRKARAGDAALSAGDELGVLMLEGTVLGPQWEDLVGFSGKVTDVGAGTFESEAWIGVSSSGSFDPDAFKFGSDRKVDCAGYKVSGNSLSLNHLNDVSISGVGNGEVLGYSGGWINRTLAEAGIASTSHGSTHESGGSDEITVDVANQVSGILGTAHGGTGISGQLSNRALETNASGKIVSSGITSTELGYLDGVSSNIQSQLNGKASSTHASQHQNGGADEINVGGLSGVLADDQPPQAHDASKVTSGTFSTDRIPSLDAGKITSGTFSSDRIPNLDAGKITSGTFGTDRIPNLDASKTTSGTFSSDRIPGLDASKITSGQLDSGRIPYTIYHSLTIDSGNVLTTGSFKVDNKQVVSSRGAAVSDAPAIGEGATAECANRADVQDLRTQFNTLLSRLRAHGLIET